MNSRTRNVRRAVSISTLVLVMSLFAACEDDGSSGTGDAGDAGGDATDMANDTGNGGSGVCDDIDETACSLPWPSNLYLAEDASTMTGLRVVFPTLSLPKRANGAALDGAQWERLDGYGVGTPILFGFPNLDLSEMASQNNVAPSVEDDDHQVLFFEVVENDELERRPFWVEEDSQDETPADGVTWMRPAFVLEEGTRYIVALRNLEDTDGNEIEPYDAFQALLDGTSSDAARQAHFDEIFGLLTDAGVTKSELDLAWDFVTASSDSLHGAMLHIRDEALAADNGMGPPMTVTDVIEYDCDEEGDNFNDGIAFRFEGTFAAPYFLRPGRDDVTGTDPPSEFNIGASGMPEMNGRRDAPFFIMVPCVAVGAEADGAGLIQYGHGLNGSGSQVYGGFNERIAREYNYIFFGNDFIGMSSGDVGTIFDMIGDLSNFHWLVDRMHQGIVEFVLLARSMQNRFPALTEVTSREIQVDPTRNYYSGISQGGIYGGTVVAVSPDQEFGHLGVPGQNYSILLNRSVDFDPFLAIIKGQHPAAIDRAIVLSLMQSMWDQVDPSSYHRHLSAEPFPGQNPSYAIFAPAKGDYQVAPMTNLISANSDYGIAVMEGYGQEISHLGLTEQSYGTEEDPYVGSAIVNWDLGNPWPEPGNKTPDDTEFCFAQRGMSPDCTEEECIECDPHGIPRYFPELQEQMIHFFENEGEVIDVCGGNGCIFRAPQGCWGRSCNWSEQ